MEDDLSKYFTDRLLDLIKGLGEKSAKAVVEDAGSLTGLLELKRRDLKLLETEGGQTVFNSEQIDAFLELRKLFGADKSSEENCIKLLILKFIDRNISSVSSKDTIRKLNINPFIIRGFDLKDPHRIIEFYLYQSVTRGIVTSMGDQFEKLAKVVSLNNTDQAGFDGELVKDGSRYFVQVKSGPDVLNKDMLERLGVHMNNAKEEHPKCETLLGLAYGTRQQISDKIANYLPGGLQSVKIGEEFWEFISGKKDYYQSILSTISEATGDYQQFVEVLYEMGDRAASDYQKEETPNDSSLVGAINEQADVLKGKWIKQYGSLEKDTTKKMLKDIL